LQNREAVEAMIKFENLVIEWHSITEPGSVEPVWKLQREHSATSRGPFNTEPSSLSDRVQQTPPRTQRWTTHFTHFAVEPRDLDPVAKAPRFCIEWCTLSGNLSIFDPHDRLTAHLVVRRSKHFVNCHCQSNYESQPCGHRCDSLICSPGRTSRASQLDQ